MSMFISIGPDENTNGKLILSFFKEVDSSPCGYVSLTKEECETLLDTLWDASKSVWEMDHERKIGSN